MKRGTGFLRYVVSSIEITPVDAATPKLEGVPVVWRPRPNSADGGDNQGTELALMSWTPFATPAAVVGGSELDAQITSIWGGVCKAGAPATSVIWSFRTQAAGASKTGWKLTGIAAPDPPDTVRSGPPPLLLRVTEPWRPLKGNNPQTATVLPALVISQTVRCTPQAPAATQPLVDWTKFSSAAQLTTVTLQKGGWLNNDADMASLLRYHSMFVSAAAAPSAVAGERLVL